MKVKTITRMPENSARECKTEPYIVHKNTDPHLHPFQQAREYVRAVNAAKLDRLFAKPFVASLSGHLDGIYCLDRHPTELKLVASGSADGEFRIWNMATQKCILSKKAAHSAFIRSLAFLPHSTHLITGSDDKTVRLWNYEEDGSQKEARTFTLEGTVNGVAAHRNGSKFASAGTEGISLWDVTRADPIQSFNWGADSVTSVRFNPAEIALLGSCASDCSLALHDTRTSTSIAKLILRMRCNSLAWNPQEAFYFSAASEDGNAYTFDMRYFDRAVNVMRGHVGAVMDLDYDPTGRQIVTASYDQTIRLYDVRAGNSRDVYHGMRMQRLFAVRFSMDSNYVMSGSDDGNLRIWKSHASQPLGLMTSAQSRSLNYNHQLLEKYGELPEVRRIANHRRLPKYIKSKGRREHEHRMSQLRKQENVRRTAKPGTAPPKSNLRDEAIIHVKK